MSQEIDFITANVPTQTSQRQIKAFTADGSQLYRSASQPVAAHGHGTRGTAGLEQGPDEGTTDGPESLLKVINRASTHKYMKDGDMNGGRNTSRSSGVPGLCLFLSHTMSQSFTCRYKAVVPGPTQAALRKQRNNDMKIMKRRKEKLWEKPRGSGVSTGAIGGDEDGDKGDQNKDATTEQGQM